MAVVTFAVTYVTSAADRM